MPFTENIYMFNEREQFSIFIFTMKYVPVSMKLLLAKRFLVNTTRIRTINFSRFSEKLLDCIIWLTLIATTTVMICNTSEVRF